MIFSYAAIYVVGVSAPTILQWGFGQSLATLSAEFSTQLVRFAGIPTVWNGTQFALVSRTGDTLTATVTPGCSSMISITTFLGLLGLLHLDMKKKLTSTIKLAISGVAILTILNAFRILILIWVGYTKERTKFWSLHNWVGYSMFLGFYMVAILVYSRMGTRGGTVAPLNNLNKRFRF